MGYVRTLSWDGLGSGGFTSIVTRHPTSAGYDGRVVYIRACNAAGLAPERGVDARHTGFSLRECWTPDPGDFSAWAEATLAFELSEGRMPASREELEGWTLNLAEG